MLSTNKGRREPSNERQNMKKMLLTCLTAAALLPAQGQLFGPNTVAGGLWGALLGGLAGGDCRNGFSGNGAAIGAGVGLAVGALADYSQRRAYYDSGYSYGPGYAYAPAPSVTFGYGYGNCGSAGYVYYAPNSYCAPGYYYPSTRPNYAVNGTLMGAASGALIGSGSHDAGKGAAIGAVTGLALGSVAEISARRREQPSTIIHSAPGATPQTYATPVAQASYQVPATRQATVRHSPPQRGVASRPVATSTYTWTARPAQSQITDAQRVPNAPTF